MRPGMHNPSSPLEWQLSEASPHGLPISHLLLCWASVAAIWQDAEKVRQQRSRVVQTLNVPQGYASALHSLRPCWTAFLSILRKCSLVVLHMRTIEILMYRNGFPQPARLDGGGNADQPQHRGGTPGCRRTQTNTFRLSPVNGGRSGRNVLRISEAVTARSCVYGGLKEIQKLTSIIFQT